jgi:hypothetical protein
MRFRDAAACLAMPMVWSFLMVPSSAAASSFDNMYPTGHTFWTCPETSSNKLFCQTDNATLTVYRQSSLSSDDKAEIETVLHSQYSPTSLAVSIKSSGVYTGSSETDIVYQRSNSGFASNEIGMTWCDDAVTQTKCDQQYVRFRYSGLDAELVCHETGHAVGLTHGADAYPYLNNNDGSALGCMETPDSLKHKTLGARNTDEINSTY